MQIKVLKKDGSTEKYAHTKVLWTLNNAMVLTDQPNIFAAEQFAEAITFYFYQEKEQTTVTSDEIHLMVQSVLNATGYDNAAQALNNYRINRRIRRNRVIVADGEQSDQPDDSICESAKWNKSVIARDLVEQDGLEMEIARAIASTVEEKVLNLGLSRVGKKLIKQLVINDKTAMLRAEKSLQMAV